MKYKFIGQENSDDDHHLYLQFGSSNKSLEVEIRMETELQHPVGEKMLIDAEEIDNLIKALHEIKEEISGKKSETFKIIKDN
ncbi:hypothetical protein [Aquimarina muelleri]|nr:hypothetical protein [Aquimarina muelleri]